MVYKNTTINKKIIYPIFVKCSELCTDPFWKKLYLSLSINKPPKTLYISNGSINSVCKNKKSFSYTFDLKSSEDIVIELYDVITNNTSLLSNKDIKKKMDEINKIKEEIKIDNSEWKLIKKKNVKTLYIYNYCIDMKHKYKLDWDKTNDLCNLIKRGFLLKLQSNDDIEYSNGKIYNIKGIVYDKKEKKFININTNSIIKIKPENNIENCLYYYWPKLVTNLQDHVKQNK